MYYSLSDNEHKIGEETLTDNINNVKSDVTFYHSHFVFQTSIIVTRFFDYIYPYVIQYFV